LGDIWKPEDHVKMVAVDSSFCHSRFVRAKKADVLECIIKKIDQATASEIGRVLRPAAGHEEQEGNQEC